MFQLNFQKLINLGQTLRSSGVFNRLGKPRSQILINSNRNNCANVPKKRVPIYQSSRNESDKKVSGFGYFLMLVPITTFGLGTWQVYRKQWKEGLIKKMESKVHMPAVPLPDE